MLKSIGLDKIEIKEEKPKENHDLRNGLIAWGIIIAIFILVLTKGN